MFDQGQMRTGKAPRVRALLVDDCLIMETKLRELLATIPDVETIGFARNGKEAVDLAQSLRPELVVMDIQMPVMNGIEAARALKETLPATRVILTSAAGTVQLPGLGAVEFVPKAKLWDALPGLVEKLLGTNN